MEFSDILAKSAEIRQLYHKLECEYHGSKWSIEEDALAFLTDAGLVGRYTMSMEKRWPADDTNEMLRHKLSECIWWLAVLADRMNIDLEESLKEFLETTYDNVKTDD